MYKTEPRRTGQVVISVSNKAGGVAVRNSHVMAWHGSIPETAVMGWMYFLFPDLLSFPASSSDLVAFC